MRRSLAAFLLIVSLACAFDVRLSEAWSQAQTDVQGARHGFDDRGVATLDIDKVGIVHHPAWIALYGLAFGGQPAYSADHTVAPDPQRFSAAVEWLEANLKQTAKGKWAWEYAFDTTYNDVTISAPWSSAFGQAAGIEALVLAYQKTKEKRHLDVALKAAQILFEPLNTGGLLFQRGDDVWFEEVPSQANEPGHILNGHMRALIALNRLAEASGDTKIKDWLKKGTDTLLRWLPRYDTGYALRYDLNPRKTDLLFRLANPYGFEGLPLAVSALALIDPVTGKRHAIDMASEEAFQGDNRIAGVHWTVPEKIGDRAARRLVPASIEHPEAMEGPHSYFYFKLPGEWTDHLRTRDYELEISYFDEAVGHMAVQHRSISPGQTFRDMRDGDLFLNGEGVWRDWKIPLRAVDLGYPVGELYAEKHAEYLAAIAAVDKRFAPWAKIAAAYERFATSAGNGKRVTPDPVVMPPQTPMLPIYSVDKKGVLTQHKPDEGSRFGANGMYDPDASRGSGVPTYSPYVIAHQLLEGQNVGGGSYTADTLKVERKPALDWFLDERNQVRIGGAVLYSYPFDNTYNDVVTKAPWVSAFGQAYVLNGLIYAMENKIAEVDVRPLAEAVIKSFAVDVRDGGIRTTGLDGIHYYEEVPNGTHVLNAHLISSVMLHDAETHIERNDETDGLFRDSIVALHARLADFDTGYWLRYDLNPKKEFLLQLDWYQGNASPLIDRVTLTNPETGNYVEADVGANEDFSTNAAHISGTDWGQSQTVDDATVRSFLNGYERHGEPVAGGTRQNVYLSLALPDRPAVGEGVQAHVLRIRYKDVAAGVFGVSIQAIHEGNTLTFVPLRQAVLRTTGDGAWKEAKIIVRPQDMGWYKGPDYQRYEVEQMKRLADLTGDWRFAQYALRHGDFLQRYEKRLPLFKTLHGAATASLKLQVVTSSKTYDGFGFANALDGDPNDDYVAGIEGENAFVELRFKTPVLPSKLRLVWENAANYARHVRITHCGRVLTDAQSEQPMSEVDMTNVPPLASLRIEFEDFAGQPRLLLRKLDLQGEKAGAERAVENCKN